MRKIIALIALAFASVLGASAQTAPAIGNLTAGSGGCNVANSCVSYTIAPGVGSVTIMVGSIPAFSGTVNFEFVGADGYTTKSASSTDSSPVSSTTSGGIWQFNAGAYTVIRARMYPYTSGTAAITISGSTASAKSNSGGGGGTGCVPAGAPGDVLNDSGSGACNSEPDIVIASHTMTVGSGGSITPSGSGVNNANEVNGAVVSTSSAVAATNSSKQIVAATAAGLNGVVQGLTGCNTANYVYTPQAADCVPGGVVPNAQTGTTYTYLASDRLGYTTFSNASPIAAGLPQAGTTGFASNWVNKSCNIGAGTVTITPTTSTISYTNWLTYTSGASSVALTTGQCIFIYSDNTNYFANLEQLANLGTPTTLTLTNATGLPVSTGISGLGTNAAGSLAVSSTTFTNATTAVGGNACSASAATVTMTGATSSMVPLIGPSADISGGTGWGSTGGLVIDAWFTSNTLNYKLCNQTAGSITPTAETWNVSAR